MLNKIHRCNGINGSNWCWIDSMQSIPRGISEVTAQKKWDCYRYMYTWCHKEVGAKNLGQWKSATRPLFHHKYMFFNTSNRQVCLLISTMQAPYWLSHNEEGRSDENLNGRYGMHLWEKLVILFYYASLLRYIYNLKDMFIRIKCFSISKRNTGEDHIASQMLMEWYYKRSRD